MPTNAPLIRQAIQEGEAREVSQQHQDSVRLQRDEVSEWISLAPRSGNLFKPRVWISRILADRVCKHDADLRPEDFQSQKMFRKASKNNFENEAKRCSKACRFFAAGICEKGSGCKFEHTQDAAKFVWQPKVKTLEKSSVNDSTS